MPGKYGLFNVIFNKFQECTQAYVGYREAKLQRGWTDATNSTGNHDSSRK